MSIISTNRTYGIYLDNGYAPPVTVANGISITDANPGGIALWGSRSWDIINDGSLYGAQTGISLPSGTVTNNGTIAGGNDAVVISGSGDVTNTGTISNTVSIAGGYQQISTAINNTGTITSAPDQMVGSNLVRYDAINIAGDTVDANIINSGTIDGDWSVLISGASVNVSLNNTGLIGGIVPFKVSATQDITANIVNTGTMQGGVEQELVLASSGTLNASVVNNGWIAWSTFDGTSGHVDLTNYGSMGFIQFRHGVDATVTEYGSINGVNFGSGGQLIVYPTATINRVAGGSGLTTLTVYPAATVGSVNGGSLYGGGPITLQLEAGALGTVGSISGVSGIELADDANWALSGTDTMTAGATIDLAKGGYLSIFDSLSVAGDFKMTGNGTLSGSVEIGSTTGGRAGPFIFQVDRGAAFTGSGTITGRVDDSGTIAADGYLNLRSGVVAGTGTLLIEDQSTMVVNGITADGVTVEFATGSNETLGTYSPVSCLIKGFAAGDTVSLYNGNWSFLSYAAGLLTLQNGTSTTSLHFDGSYSASQFVLSYVNSGTEITLQRPVKFDPKSDILFQNSANGQLALWQMNGATVTASGLLGSKPGSSWYAMGTGTFFGWTSDIVWQNGSGPVAIWAISGSTIVGGGLVASNPGPTWHIKATADFNGDDRTDVLFQNDNGSVAIWDMNGTSIIGGGLVSYNPGPTWHIKGTGDFYGDGHSDILWQNDNGQAAIWDMSGTAIVGAGIIASDPGPTWRIKGTGDFNGDGHTDILFQNNNGSVAIWEMNGTSIIGGGLIASDPGPTWHIKGTGDLNHDGYTDIIWQNDKRHGRAMGDGWHIDHRRRCHRQRSRL